MGKEYTRSMSILGSLPVAGQVIFYDNFESLLKWTKTAGEGDSIFELDPSLSQQESQSLHLKTRTTSADIGDEIVAGRNMHLLPSKVLSFACLFHFSANERIEHIQFLFKWHDGSNRHSALIRYRPDNPDWAYQNTTPEFVSIPNSDVLLEALTWHLIVLRINFDTDKYLSLQINNLLFDLSAFPLFTDALATTSYLLKRISIQTSTAFPAALHLDEIIIHEL